MASEGGAVRGTIESVNVSEAKGIVKRPVASIELDRRGVCQDAHAGDWHRQVSLLAREQIERFAARLGRPIAPGEFAENLTIGGIDLSGVVPLDRFVSGGVELEVTQIGKACHGEGCAIFREVGACVMPKEGVFLRVVSGGRLRPGDPIEYRPRPLRCLVITLSDRASRGEYEDRSGPRLHELLLGHCAGRRWHPDLRAVLLPDDAARLEAELVGAAASGVDLVFTTGGTGIGPRDITPDVVLRLADKTIPGIMEMIRVRHGADKPNALASRSVAAVIGQTLVFCLPGSVRAVEEYLAGILPTLEHLIFMLHGLDRH